ncbi:MAG: DGQHR domain-containing protein [Ruminococcaceae bacterium]|nr:DGQHR domain-containing protein [Oscillospiraceae bacterium]
MTITDAAIKVLENEENGLTIQEIYDKIIKNGYFDFGAKKPIDVLRIQIMRYCEDKTISFSSNKKIFTSKNKDGTEIFMLKNYRGQVMDENKRYKYVSTKINNITIYTLVMSVKDLANISYVAIRGKDTEDGAVQRVLNRQRITSIKNYVLDDNLFVNTFVINWTYTDNQPIITKNEIELPIIYGAAQLIDGQHRLEGIKAAMTEKPELADKTIIVSLAINLGTKDAAKIFLNINSEQKPVPKSLIYDLYGVTDEDRNYALNRAEDIARILNEEINSPFYNAIKYPGMPRGKGKLDLSTVVNALKIYVDHNGKLEEKNLTNLNLQATVLQNYFNALKYHADKASKWSTISSNIFYKAAGFIGAVEFFMENVLPKCVEQRSFKQEVIAKMFDFSEIELITPKNIETTDGRTARKRVIDNLKEAFISDIPGESDYDF